MLKKTNILILTLLANSINELDAKFKIVKNGKKQFLLDLEQALSVWPMSLISRKQEIYSLPNVASANNAIIKCKYLDIIENLPIVHELKNIFPTEIFEDFLDIFYWYIGEPVVESHDKLDLAVLHNPSDYLKYLFDGSLTKNKTIFSLGGFDFKITNDPSFNYLFLLPNFFINNAMGDRVLLLDSLNRPFSYKSFKDIHIKPKLIIANYSKAMLEFLNLYNVNFCLRLNSLHDISNNIFTRSIKMSVKIMERYESKRLERPFLLCMKTINYKKYYLYCYFIPTGDEVRSVKLDLLLDYYFSPKNHKHYFEIFQETYVKFFLTNKKLVLEKSKLLPVHNSRLEWNQYILDKVNYLSESSTRGHSNESISYLGMYLLFVEAALSDISNRINAIMKDIYNSNYHYSLKDVVEILHFNESLSSVHSATFEVSTFNAVSFEKIRYYKKFLELLESIITNNQ
ncbi:hypothetical protein ACNQ2L_01790 [Mycoplasma sp. T193]|uniref:hypothetical protein n=1 Tax=unclassified Mycoplasma TaxID=2683645 RepID=UPI003AAADEE5